MALVFGYFSLNDSKQEPSFEKALERFTLNGQRETSEYKTKNSKIYCSTSVIPHHIDLTQNQSELDFYSGYTYKNSDQPIEERVKAICTSLKDLSQKRFAHNFFKIEIKKDRALFETDLLGGMPLFYCTVEQTCFFCSEFDPLIELTNKDLPFDETSLRNFLNFGFTLPGETLHQNIKMVAPGTIVEFSPTGTSIRTPEYQIPDTHNFSLKAVAEKMTNELSDAVNGIFKDLKIDRLSISGNCDTRIILGLMDEDLRSSIHFDTRTSNSPTKGQFANLLVARDLNDLLGLNLEEKHQDISQFSFQNYFTRFQNPYIRRMFPKFGYEFMQGGSIETLPYLQEDIDFSEPNTCFDYIDIENSKQSLGNYFEWLYNTPVINKELYSSILMYRSSFMSTMYQADPFWVSPYQHIAKQLSPFNLGEILWELCHLPFELIQKGTLVIEILKSLPKELTEIPFADLATRNVRFPFKDVYQDHRLIGQKFSNPNYQIPFDHLFELVSLKYYWQQENQFKSDSLVEIHRQDTDETTRKFLLLFLYRRFFFSDNGNEFLIDLNPEGTQVLPQL